MTNPSNHTVLIIADDLTGAVESTAAFARQGFKTRVIADVNNWSETEVQGYDVVAFNSQTRNCTTEESSAIIRALARRLVTLDPRLILKRIDSTFRGQILSETSVILEELGLERTVIAPAYPSHKRITSGGRIFVDGIPLRDTHYSRTPTPPPSDIPAAIRETFGDVLVFSGLSTQNLPETPPAGVYLPDILLEEDLTRTARWVIAQGNSILPVGSAGLAHAFARFLIPSHRTNLIPPKPSPSGKQKMLFVVGSTLPEISNQVRALTSSRQDVVVVDAANGNRIDVDINSVEEAIIVLKIVRGSSLITRDEAADNLAETARLFMDLLPISHLVTVGGDTSNSVINKLGITGFDILPQDVIGFPRGDTQYDNRSLTYIAKSAGYSDSAIFASIADTLLPRMQEPNK